MHSAPVSQVYVPLPQPTHWLIPDVPKPAVPLPVQEREEEKGLLCFNAKRTTMLKLAFSAIFELVRVVVACMLSILVPTRCGPDSSCGPYDVIANSSLPHHSFSVVVFIWNLLTLVLAVLHYQLMTKRERAMQRLLSYSYETAADRFPEMAPVYPEVNNAIRAHHLRVFLSGVVFLTVFVVNIILSAILIFGYRYYGLQSGTVYATNVVLLIGVLNKSLSQSWAGLQNGVADSLFQYLPICYNVVNLDFVDARDKTKGGRIDNDDPVTGEPIVPEYHFNAVEQSPEVAATVVPVASDREEAGLVSAAGAAHAHVPDHAQHSHAPHHDHAPHHGHGHHDHAPAAAVVASDVALAVHE